MASMKGSTSLTDVAALALLAERVAAHRVRANQTQAQLAREAGVSKRTIERLEAGESTQLTNLIRVLRALGLLSNLDALVPMPPLSPIRQLKAEQRRRRRASPGGSGPKHGEGWTWADEGRDP